VYVEIQDVAPSSIPFATQPIPRSQLPLPHLDLQRGQTVGSATLDVRIPNPGGSTDIWKGHTDDDRQVVCKIPTTQLAVEAIEREVNVLDQVGHHPGVPSLVDAPVIANSVPTVVTAFIPGQPLYLRIAEEHGIGLSWQDVVNLAVQGAKILQDLNYGYAKPGVHVRNCDVSTRNFIVTPDQQMYLVDFGLAEITKGRKSGITTIVGTPGFISPERRDGIVDPRTDVYAHGAVMQSMLMGSTRQRESAIMWRAAPPMLRHLILSCLEPQPRMRPTFEEVTTVLHQLVAMASYGHL
jgi:serine/threonine protein kinase